MIKFSLEQNSQEGINAGYPKDKPVALVNNEYNYPLSDYFIMLEYYYIRFRDSNNIDGWLFYIDEQLFTRANKDYYGDNVCVFFRDDKVQLINYWDYEAGKDNYCEIAVEELRKLTIEWKWFVIDWEIKMMKGEI